MALIKKEQTLERNINRNSQFDKLTLIYVAIENYLLRARGPYLINYMHFVCAMNTVSDVQNTHNLQTTSQRANHSWLQREQIVPLYIWWKQTLCFHLSSTCLQRFVVEKNCRRMASQSFFLSRTLQAKLTSNLKKTVCANWNIFSVICAMSSVFSPVTSWIFCKMCLDELWKNDVLLQYFFIFEGTLKKPPKAEQSTAKIVFQPSVYSAKVTREFHKMR